MIENVFEANPFTDVGDVPEYIQHVVPLFQYEELKHKYDALVEVHDSIKLELKDANVRNMALQRIIVKNAFVAAPVPFVSVVRHSVSFSIFFELFRLCFRMADVYMKETYSSIKSNVLF